METVTPIGVNEARRDDREAPPAPPERLRLGLVMEQVLGHVTWYQNLRRGVEATAPERGVDARWVETAMWDATGRLERMPGLPDFVKASGRAFLDMRRGLQDWPYDVLLF